MKVTRKEPNFTTTGTNNSTAGVTIDAKLTAGYNDRIVNTAIQLKANYGNKYSDEYYLNAASSWYKEELGAAFKAAYSKNTNKCPIKDSQWAGYSYEEIIQMENSGVKIPQDVLLWAHAQQESDVTAYEVISTTSANDDNSSTEELVGDFDLNSLQTKAKQSVMKATEAEKNTQSVTEEYNKNKDRALEIKNENNNSYQKSMNEISNLTNEWKKLDKKAKSGQLSETEQSRYQELSKMLGNKSSSSLKEIEVNSKELDNLLSSMDLFETKATENETIADDAIQAGKDLSNLNKNYHEMQQTHSTSGVVYSNMGLLSDVLYGITGSSIEKIAIETGKDLTETSDNEIAELHSSGDIAMFANAYTSNVVETKQATVVTQNTEEENKADNTEKTDENNNPIVDNNKAENTNIISDNTEAATNSNPIADNNVQANTNTEETNQDNTNNTAENTSTNEEDNKDLSLEFTYQNARKATEVTQQTTNDIVKGQENTDKTNKDLQKQSIKSQKDVQKVNQEVAKAESTYAKNAQEQAALLSELEKLQTEAANPEATPVVQSAEEDPQQQIAQQSAVQPQAQQSQSPIKQAAIQSLSNNQNGQPNTKAQDNMFKQLEIVSGLNIIESQNQKIEKGLDIAFTTGKNSINNVQKTVKSLADENAQLILNNAKHIVNISKATFIGIGTTEKSIVTTAAGTTLVATGSALLSNPLTASKGLNMIKAGNKLIVQGSLEFTNGVAATTTALAASLPLTIVSDTMSIAKSAVKQGAIVAKSGMNELKNITQSVGAATELAIPDVSVVGEVAKTVGANVQGLIPNPKNLVPNNPSQKNDGQNNNQENQNTLDSSFSFANAVNSTMQTLSATQDLSMAALNLDKKDSTVDQQNKKSQGLVKSIEKDAAKALSIQEEDDKKAENSVSASVQSIANPVSAQNDVTAGLEKSINKNIQQLNVFKKDSTDLNGIISSHEKSSSNLIDVSTNAVVVGLGTRALGAVHTGVGSLLITEGAVLLPNPVTHAAGVVKTAIGTGLVKQGTLETLGGVTSQLTGEAGLLTGGIAKATTSVAKSIMKTSTTEQKDADKRIKTATKELDNQKKRTRTFSFNSNNDNTSNNVKTSTSSTDNQDVQVQAQQNDNQQQPIQMQSQQGLNIQSAIAFNSPDENEDEVIDTEKIENQAALETAIVENNTESGEFTNDPTLLGASATTNADVKSNTQTDDKADRKLSRFNMDSIIESKKKRKKVQAVSASSKG